MRGLGAVCRRSPVWVLGVLIVTAGALWLASGSARAALVWSAPVFLDAGADAGLADLACPTAAQCVAVDSHGRAVSFDPAQPRAWSADTIDATRALAAVACPSASQCVAVDGRGAAVTFDPEDIGAAPPRRYVVDPGPLVTTPGNALVAVSCASASLCIAVDQQGRVISFAPGGPPDARTAAFSAEPTFGGQHLLACPSSAQCSVLSAGGAGTGSQPPVQTLITFDPRSLAVVATTPVPSSVALTQLACPTVTECVGAGLTLSEVGGRLGGSGTTTVTFAPTSSTAGPALARGDVSSLALACASASLCTAMDASGAELSFDPSGSGLLQQAAVDPLGDYSMGANISQIACPTSAECVLATWNDSDAITFAPLSPGKPVPVPIDDGAPISAVACPAAGECVGLAGTQLQDTLPFTVAARLDARSQAHVEGIGLLSGTARGIACPKRTQCTAVAIRNSGCGGCSPAAGTAEITFNPYKPVRRYPFGAPGIEIDKAAGAGLACPGPHRCILVDHRGRELSFDPLHPRARSVHRESARALSAVSCPSAVQCTAVGKGGIEVTFAPGTGSLLTSRQIDGTRQLTAVACPTPRRCSAVDQRGREIAFDPQRIGQLVAQQIGTARLTGVACPSPRACVAVTAAGGVAVGDPFARRRWTVASVPGASSLLAVACSSSGGCVVADAAGRMFASDLSGVARP